ncbi:DUF4233 domain-containing protein [Klenkia brasiliensis]|uniref:DUF4233 domain-containing protein n=1 Tax=Klenkia brasiliensis TaxID=333142 RepID=A0A1G7UL03_9ACTN|nr:DUF4233 domain-containing protein [Klenkia brasiliensis]SDG47410.1 Protein of unknown function [Klenkia brasiliensis]
MSGTPRAADPARAAKALSGAAAATLFLEGLAVLFVPRAIAQTDGLGGGVLTVLVVLAVVLVLASGVQRRPQGLLMGTVLQVPLLLTGLASSAMWFVGGVFLLIWLYLLQTRKDLVGSPFGPVPDPPATGR